MKEGSGTRSTVGARRRLVIALLVAVVIAGAYAVRWRTGLLDRLAEGDTLRQAVVKLGAAGPLLIIALLAAAIVVSPVPSAPIALAAGAAYGHFWGTLYVAAGSLAGALIAFAVARLLGYDIVRAWLGTRPSHALLARFMSSQNALMAAVFATRLMPFLSFDIISYAAGLTPLTAWRFTLATLLGIVPASFLLAHFGEGLASADLRRVGLTVLLLGAVTLTPLAWRVLPGRWRVALRGLMPRGAAGQDAGMGGQGRDARRGATGPGAHRSDLDRTQDDERT